MIQNRGFLAQKKLIRPCLTYVLTATTSYWTSYMYLQLDMNHIQNESHVFLVKAVRSKSNFVLGLRES